MPDPCKQGPTIARLEVNDERLFEILDRIENNQERFITAIERIAEQGGAIKRNTHDIDVLFSRVRDLELKPGTEGSAVKLSLINAVIATVIAFLVSAVKTK